MITPTLGEQVMSLLAQIASLPGTIILTLLSMVGLAAWPRQVVRVMPRLAAHIRMRTSKGDGKLSNGHGGGEEGQTVSRWISENVPSLKGTFRPAWWLPNGHLQTMYSVVGNFLKVDKITYKRTYLRVPDGGTIGLDFTEGYDSMSDEAPILVICHGLTGGSHESYVRNVLTWVVQPKSEGGLEGRAVVVNFRGCANTPLTSTQLYSAATTVDLELSLHYLRHRYPNAPLHGIGFSLGASVLTNYLGNSSSSSLLSSGLALGCPWNLPGMSVRLEGDALHRIIYSGAMATNVMRIFFRQYDHTPQVFDRDELFVRECVPQLKVMRKKKLGVRLKDVDEVMTSRLGGPHGEGLWPFKSAEAYYEYASPFQRVEAVKRPTLAINAFDDPVIDGKYLPVEEVHASSHVFLAITGSGGHLGWFDGNWFSTKGSKQRWVLAPAQEFLTAATRDLGVEGGGLEVVREDGWDLVESGGHEVQGGGRRGWRVLREGGDVDSTEGTGALQGL